ncbi:transposase InsB2 [Ahrensia sp. R2A130]|nr:transposase InsB2 [Ahrensia sp. R2A130]
MATDDMEPVRKGGVDVLFPSEARALRGAMDVLLMKVQQDIVSHRDAIDGLGLKRPSPLQELSRVFSTEDAERVYHKPGKSVPVVRKRRKETTR